jgi:hypothetical protein
MSKSLVVLEPSSGAAGAGYKLAVDINFAAQPNQSLATDGNYTIANQTFTKINSANDQVAMALTNGQGVVIQPKNGTDYSQGGRTLPALIANLASMIPGFSLSTPFRMWLYVSSDNPAANYDNTVFVAENGGLNWGCVAKKGFFAASNGLYITSLVGGTNQAQAGNAVSTHNVMLLDFPEGLLACMFGLRAGDMGIGIWPSLASLAPQWQYKILNGTTDDEPLFGGSGMNLSNLFDVLLGAQTTSNQGTYSTTLARLKIEYVSELGGGAGLILPNVYPNLLRWGIASELVVGNPNVTNWGDLSQNALDLNSTSSNPQQGSSINGKPALSFTGTEYLVSSGTSLSASAFNGSFAAYVVVESTVANQTPNPIPPSGGLYNPGGNVTIYELDPYNGWAITASPLGDQLYFTMNVSGFGPWPCIIGGHLVQNVPTIVAVTFDATIPGGGTGTATLYQDGVSVGSATFTTCSATPTVLNMATYYGTVPSRNFQGLIAEDFMYSSFPMANEFRDLNRYLGNKYGIVVP